MGGFPGTNGRKDKVDPVIVKVVIYTDPTTIEEGKIGVNAIFGAITIVNIDVPANSRSTVISYGIIKKVE